MTSIEAEQLKAAAMLHEIGHFGANWLWWYDVAKMWGLNAPQSSQFQFEFDLESMLATHAAERITPEHSSKEFVVEVPETDLDGLRKEVEDLRTRNERLRSLVSQERRVSANESRRNDQLLARYDAERESRNDLLDTLKEMAKANNALQSALTAEKDGRMRMFESHHGVVMHVNDDSVVVTYLVDGEYVDQTYSRDQFIGGQLLKKGERLRIYVHVAELPNGQTDEVAPGDRADEQRRHREKAVRPPREF